MAARASGPVTLGWESLQALLCVLEQGSLSRAAHALGVSQPTLTRQVAQIEAQLGVPLFERTTRGMAPTALARQLLDPLQVMRQQASTVLRRAQGHDAPLHGVVRISASESLAAHVLPPMLAALRTEMPDIDLVLIATDRIVDLVEREADIALRMLRPDQPDLVARKLSALRVGIFASADYLRRRGTPRSVHELLDHDVVGFGDPALLLQSLADGGLDASRLRFAALANSHCVAWELVRAGMGIGFIAVAVGERDPGVRRLLPEAPTPTLPLWLTVHREVRGNARLRRVFDFLGARLSGIGDG